MSEGHNNWWLPAAFSAAVQGLYLNPAMLHRMNYEQVLAHMDEARLFRLVEPLPLSRPSEVARQLEEAGGPQALFCTAAQAAIASWGTMHRAVQVLRELSRTISALLRAHRQGQLGDSHTVLRSLSVIAISGFVPGSGALRGDLAAILGGSPEDVPGLIKNFRIVALSSNEAVTAIDQRIQADPVWSLWVQTFLKEGRDLVRLCRPSTCWEFPQSDLSEKNGRSISHWLFRRR
jgi:hypothetical protein